MNSYQVNNSGTVAFWSFENQYRDSGGSGYTLNQSGVVPYIFLANTPRGQFSAGPFSTSNYFTASSGVFNQLSGLQNSTIEFDTFLLETGISIQIFTEILNPILPINNTAQYRLNVNGSLEMIKQAFGGPVSKSLLTTGVWYNVKFINANSQQKIYINDSLDGNTTSISNYFANVSGLYIGVQSTPANRFNGYIKNFRISNYDRSTNNLFIGSPGTTG